MMNKRKGWIVAICAFLAVLLVAGLILPALVDIAPKGGSSGSANQNSQADIANADLDGDASDDGVISFEDLLGAAG